MSTLHDTVRPAGSRRFVWTVLAFALANVAVCLGFILYHGPNASSAALPMLRVERFAPGEAQTISSRQPLSWTFNSDVGPEQSGGVISDAPGTLVPNVAGRWSWTDRRTLVFTPEREYPKATRFTLTLLPQKLIPPAGVAAMAQPFVATVQTRALQLASVRHIGASDGQPLLELAFNDAVLASDVLKHVSVAAPSGKNCQLSLHGKADGKVVRLRCQDPAARPLNASPTKDPTYYMVAIAPGLAGTSGPLAMEAKTTCVVTVASQVMATGASAHCPPDGDPEISLVFNSEVRPEIVKQVLSIEPAIPFTVQPRWGTQLAVQGEFKPGTRYSLKINPPPAGGGNEYPKPGTLSVFINDRPAHVWLEHEEGYLGSRGNRSLAAHAVNVPALRVTIVRIYDNTLVAWRNAADRRRYGRADPAPFARPIVSRRIDLAAAPRNQVQHLTLSLDELLPESARGDGVYRVQVEPESTAASAREYDGDDDDFPRYRSWQTAAMVTLSDIGLSAKQGRDGQTGVWAISLSSGKPMEGVRVRLFSNKSQPLGEATTGGDGLATLKSATPAPGEQPVVLIADKAAVEREIISREEADAAPSRAQLTWLDLRSGQTTFADADVGGRGFLRGGYEAFIYTHRGVYRPGDTVQLRTILRGANQSIPQPFPVKWQLRRPDLREWKSQVVTLDTDGAAGLTLALPADLPTGRWTAQVGLAGETRGPGANLGSVTFQVEEYIPERIKAAVSIAGGSERPQRLTLDATNLKAALQADYLFGRPAARLRATLNASLSPTRFTSPAWRGWAFGDTANALQTLDGRTPPMRRLMDPTEAATSDAGQAQWPIDLKKLQQRGKVDGGAAPQPDGYRGPWELTLVGEVREEGGRPVTVSQSVPVDGAPHYVGIRLQETNPRAGSATTIALAAVAPSGQVHAADVPVVATLYQEQWNSVLLQENGHYRYQSTRKLEAVGAAQNLTLTQGHGQLTLTMPTGGHYVLLVRDPAAQVETSIAFYAIEPAWQENISRENPEKIDLVLLPGISGDATKNLLNAIDTLSLKGAESVKSWRSLATSTGSFIRTLARAADATADADAGMKFKVGQHPRVLVRSPFAGQLLLCIETDGVVSRQVIEMSGSQVIVPIEVTDACRPGAFITATVIRAVDPQAKWRAHRAFGVARLPLDPADRRLNLAIDTPAQMRPEQTLSATVRVTDDDGRAISGAAVTVAAVDEGILQLTHFQTPSPLAFFLSPRALGVKSADLYSMLMPEVPKPQAEAAVGGDDELHGTVSGHGGNARHNPISARRVKSVALFTGVVHTDASGIARIEMPVPAFAGKLRLMAVAYSGGGSAVSRFGSGEAETIVRSPLLVQTSLPRFATPGDRFVMPLTIFNNSQRAGEAKVRITLEAVDGNAAPLTFVGVDPKAIELAPVAPAAGGQASRSVDLVAGPGVGAVKIRLTATMDVETFTETVELPVRPPAPEITQGGFIAGKPDAPAAIAPPGGMLPGTRRLQVRVTPWPSLGLSRGLQYLDHYPYGCAEQTLSTSFPLVYLGDVGQRVAPGMFDRERIANNLQAGILRLMSMETHDGGIAMWPGGGESWPWASVYAAHFLIEAQIAGHQVPEDFRDRLLAYCRTLLEQGGDEPALFQQQAYACYVLSLAGKPPRAAMSRLGEVLARSENDAAGVSHSSARWHLALAWVSAGRRDLATALMPQVLPKMDGARQLGGNLASPLRDRALLLQAMLAIDPKRADVAALAVEVGQSLDNGRYLGTQEAAVALCALGRYLKVAAETPAYDSVELWAGDQKLATAERGQTLAWDLAAGQSPPKDLQVRVAGKPDAQAFVSWLQSGVPTDRPADADSGMTVRRKYLDISGKPVDPSRLNNGDLVRVELTLSSPGALDNVVIEDLLPAGLEVENPRLQSGATANAAAGGENAQAKEREPNVLSIRHTDIRDDRVCVMCAMTSGGKGKVSYLARAVTPGAYVVPPVRAECMYDAGIHSIWNGEGKMKVATQGEKGLVMR